MGALVPSEPVSDGPHLDRRTSRRLAAGEANACVEAQRTALVGQLQASKTDAIGHVTQAAMLNVTQISEWEGMLGKLSPLAVSRLEAIADAGTLGLAEIVMTTRQRLDGRPRCS